MCGSPPLRFRLTTSGVNVLREGHFSEESLKMAGECCRRNKFGFCKFGERCRYLHIDELCESSSCDQSHCSLRHPRECFYFKKYKNCKFGEWCRYDHKIGVIEKESLKAVIAEIQTLKEEIIALKEENELLHRSLNDIKECFDRKSDEIEDRENKENYFESEQVFKCAQCEFESHSKCGLRNHVQRKHMIAQVDGNCSINEDNLNKDIGKKHVVKALIVAEDEVTAKKYLIDNYIKAFEEDYSDDVTFVKDEFGDGYEAGDEVINILLKRLNLQYLLIM